MCSRLRIWGMNFYKYKNLKNRDNLDYYIKSSELKDKIEKMNYSLILKTQTSITIIKREVRRIKRIFFSSAQSPIVKIPFEGKEDFERKKIWKIRPQSENGLSLWYDLLVNI